MIESYQIDQQYLDDYSIIKRNPEQQLKHTKALKQQPQIDQQKSIYVGVADMQFKMPQRIYKKMFNVQSQLNLGYTCARPQLFKAVRQWVHTRYDQKTPIQQNNTLFCSNLLVLEAAAINVLTKQGDKILIMVPGYYRYISDTLYWKRQPVQFQLTIKDNRLYIDFDKLEKVFQKQNIKLFILANPWNPCGRIWSRQELTKLKDLIIKYNIYLFSDEVFSDTIQPQEGQNMKDIFTSALSFRELAPLLIYGNSHTKTMNCSGMSCAYTVIQNKDLYKKFESYLFTGSFPGTLSFHLMQISYSDPEALQWRKNTIKYLKNNYLKFKKLCNEKIPDLIILELDCSYLALIDFRNYKMNFNQIRKYFTKVNLCPVFMDKSFVDQRSTSLVRINLACNCSIVDEIVERLRQISQIPWIQ